MSKLDVVWQLERLEKSRDRDQRDDILRNVIEEIGRLQCVIERMRQHMPQSFHLGSEDGL